MTRGASGLEIREGRAQGGDLLDLYPQEDEEAKVRRGKKVVWGGGEIFSPRKKHPKKRKFLDLGKGRTGRKESVKPSTS